MYGRANSSTGWPFCRAPVPFLKAGPATRWKPGSLRVASTRSLSEPGRRTAVERSATTGSASRTSGRNSRRNGARSFVAGLDSATSGARSSSVARRFTNVELPRRRVVGSSASASLSARFSEAIAPVVAFALPTRSARSSRRSAIAVTAREEETMKRVSASSSCVVSLTSRRALESSGLKYLVASAACWPWPSSWVLKPSITPCRSARASGSSVLKSASRSTAVVVEAVVSVECSGSVRLASGPGESAT